MLYERMIQAKKNLGLEEKLLKPRYNGATPVEEEVVIGQDYIDDNSEDNDLEGGVSKEVMEAKYNEIAAKYNETNGLDPDADITDELEEVSLKEEFDKNIKYSISEATPKFSEPTTTLDSEIIEFYKNHPELEGRFYPNEGLNPILTLKDYALDKAIVGLKKHGISLGDTLKTHDDYFKNINKEKSLIYSEPTIEQKEESMDMLCTNPYKKEDTSGKTESNVDTFLEKYSEGNDIIQVLRKDLMAILSDIQWIIESDNCHEQFALDFADALNELSVRI